MNKLAAIIVGYFPDDRLSNLVGDCSDQFSKVFVIFNSENTTPIKTLSNITVIENDQNYGLSKALNQGIILCQQNDIDWCVFFDQDTKILPGFSNNLTKCIIDLNKEKNLKIIGQNYINRSGTKKAYYINKLTRIEKPIVTSGSAIPISMFAEIGLFDENLFIEGIDTEYCLRALNHNFGIYVGSEILMVHGAGEDKYRSFFGRTVIVSGHKPDRYYLQWKHHIYAYKKYNTNFLKLLLKIVPGLIKNLIMIILFEQKKRLIVTACIKGLQNGFKMK